MKLHEYQSKKILDRYDVPIPKGRATNMASEAKQIAEELGGRVVIKAQVLAGGRGIAGGIRLAKDPKHAKELATEILGMEIKGLPVRKILVDEVIDIDQEIYLGIVNDRAIQRPVIIASADGGVDIEKIACEDPAKIFKIPIDPLLELQEFQIRDIALGIDLKREYWKQFIQIIKGLYKAYRDFDATLFEINPLVINKEKKMIALDAKLIVDDNALFRHPELMELKDPDIEVPAENEAQKYGLAYVYLDGNIGCLVNGAGLAMATMDVITQFGGKPANFMDVGGGAGAQKVATAFRIILSDPDVKVILVNIFGGLTRCDEVAKGILTALNDVEIQIPVIVRLVGTHAIEGREILAHAKVQTGSTLVETVKNAVLLANGSNS